MPADSLSVLRRLARMELPNASQEEIEEYVKKRKAQDVAEFEPAQEPVQIIGPN